MLTLATRNCRQICREEIYPVLFCKGIGSETAAAVSKVSGSWPFTSFGPSGCFGGMP